MTADIGTASPRYRVSPFPLTPQHERGPPTWQLFSSSADTDNRPKSHPFRTHIFQGLPAATYHRNGHSTLRVIIYQSRTSHSDTLPVAPAVLRLLAQLSPSHSKPPSHLTHCQHGNRKSPLQGTAGSKRLELLVPNLGTMGCHCKQMPVPKGWN